MYKSIKVCFVGIGSIGSRHIRNLRRICEAKGIGLTVHALRREESNSSIMGLVDEVFFSEMELPDDYDAIFITNPTSMHIETLLRIHDKSESFFIEKPICSVDLIDVAQSFNYEDNKLYYIACPMRYEKVLQYLKENINPQDVISARSICSSYLPDWRPNIDYRKCYSARKSMGGGVSIDLIHEWDYLVWLLGYPNRINNFVGKKSNLEIDSDDYALYIAEYNDKIVELHLDYFGRYPIRKLQLIMNEDTVECDFLSKRITFLKKGRSIQFEEERDDYQIREIEHFLDMVFNGVENDNTPQMACKTLKITQGILDI